jgi:hypothetical protein
MPLSVLTSADRAFLTAHRDEVRAIVNYTAARSRRERRLCSLLIGTTLDQVD